MRKILVADDEERILNIVSDFLKKSDLEVETYTDGDSAWDAFSASPRDYSLLILDIMMPGYNGWELCRRVREISKVPVIMLTARSEEFDELMAYESGADEYVTKPFRPSVLVKRVEALLRRYSAENDTGDVAVRGDRLIFNHDAHEVKLGGKEVQLTLKEYCILKMLFENAGVVFSREQILTSIWGLDYDGDVRTVDSHVARLRIKLGDWGEKHLKTVYGLGYKIEGLR